jgi:dihydroorotase
MKLLVAGGTVVTPEGRREQDVLCEDGRIAALLEPGDAAAASADERLDASGLLVFPGFIDPHVHSRDPGITEKEDFAHSTLGALCSGLTTIFDMPNAAPPVTDAAIFADRAQHHEAVASVDFGLWGQAIGSENLADLAGIVEAGAIGIKLFWGYALDRTSGRLVYTEADLAGSDVIPPPDIGGVYEIVQQVAAAGGLFSAHCEESRILAAAAAALPNGVQTYADLLAARPAVAEVVAVSAVAEFARVTGCRFHVVHVSAQRTVEVIAAARRDGVEISGEACAHYLVLSDEDFERLGPPMKVYPPIRTRDEQDALWAALADGTLTVIASDHAPHAPEEKAKPMPEQPAGIHGVETLVPIVLEAMHGGRLTPEQVAGVLSANTARIFAIDHRKGAIEAGRDADLTLVDPERAWTIRAEAMHTKHPMSVFDGMSGHGAAVASVIRGEVAMRDGEPVGGPRGRLVRAQTAAGAETPASAAPAGAAS